MGSNSVFLDCLGVNRGCGGIRIRSSHVKEFRGLLLIGQRLGFPRLFMSHQGGCRIHSLPVKAVSGAISEWEASQFSLTVYESTGAVGAYESIRHM